VELSSGALWKVHGRGAPTTLVVHGLGATDGEARIPASGLPGTRVVVTLPGHGNAGDPEPEYWSYPRIAEDVLAIADEVGATQALGVSLGAGALTRLVADHPDRFDRLALLLPATLDHPRGVAANRVFHRLVDGVDAAPADGGARLREAVAEDVPHGADVGDYVAQRAEALLRLGHALRTLPGQSAVVDAAVLGDVSGEALVISGTDDPLHPADVAKDVAGAFPRARLELLPSRAPMLTHRKELRSLLVDFLR
jgi:pimeloyl-ACP methyl ester carboxylesterase